MAVNCGSHVQRRFIIVVLWSIWRFPKIGGPLATTHFHGVFHDQPSILGTPIAMETPINQREIEATLELITLATLDVSCSTPFM